MRDLALNGDSPEVKARRALRPVPGVGLSLEPLKSRHARRELPIPLGLGDKLRAYMAGVDESELVFQSGAGTPLSPDNVHARILRPAVSEAGVAWAGFYTFRHTVASTLFAQGLNIKQVQHWLGHHARSFTLDTYVSLLDDDLGGALFTIPDALPNREAAEIGQV